MILLPPGNPIIRDLVSSKCDAEKTGLFESTVWDFDEVSYKASISPDAKDTLKIQMDIMCFKEIAEFAGKAIQDKFGDFLSEGPGDVNLKIDLAANKGKGKEIGERISLLREVVLGGPFYSFFQGLAKGSLPEKFSFKLREDTQVWFVPKSDRVTIVYNLNFKEQTDQVIARVVCQAFKEVRARDRSVASAPVVSYSPKDPPAELSSFGVTTADAGNTGFLAFTILKNHVSDDAKIDLVVAAMVSFRSFLQYHLKCSKAYFHSKMRARTRELLKILNRAKPDVIKEKKTASGKTFSRK